MLGLNAWGVGSMHWYVASRMEKDKNLQKMIQSTCFTYAQRFMMAWYVKNWIENPLKWIGHKSWQLYRISMNLKWFMEGKKK